MQRTKEEVAQLIQLLKPHVTDFSAQILKEGKNGEAVICGGKVMSIVDISQFSGFDVLYPYEAKSVLKSNPDAANDPSRDIVYVTIDDGVGEILLVVPGPIWRRSQPGLQSVIVAKGMLYNLERNMDFLNTQGQKIQLNGEEEPLRVLVASVDTIEQLLPF